jgi:alpha-L-fucosidase
VLDIPKDDVAIKGIQSKIKQVRLVGTTDTLVYKMTGGAPWLNIPGTLQIHLPTEKLDENVTVVAIDLETPVKFYRGKGDAAEKN